MALNRDALVKDIEALYLVKLDYFVRVARAITGDSDLAREAVQDAFANVIRARGSFRGDGTLEAWVWRAVVNAARSLSRRPMAEVHPAFSEQDELPLARSDLAPHIAALPERQRLAIFLRYYADLDYATIGQALSVEVGTVGATLAAAHKALRATLQEVKQ